jgi:dTDP-4-dehydrorhamnose reductase
VIWLIGDKGMLGTELSRLFERQGIPFAGTDRGVDITDPPAITAFTQAQTEPFSWIVNCAAYTAVDQAEDEAETCRRLNVDGAGNIASRAKAIGAKLIHISTDYVFDGKGIIDERGTKGGKPPLPRPYREDDPVSPIGVYSMSKYDGERAALEKGCGGRGKNRAVYIIQAEN